MAVAAGILVVLIGSAAGLAVVLDPLLDIRIATYFQTPGVKAAVEPLTPLFNTLRDYNLALTVAFVLLSFCALALKTVWPRGPMLVPARAALLILSVFALGPALLANGILKPHGGRPRPAAVVELGGTQPFVQWWDWRGECDGNCSFVSGEASAAYALLAPAAVVPAPWRVVAIGAAIAYGTAMGVLRIAVGAHFLTDVIFAGLFMALIVWLLHGCIYRWRRTRLTEESAQQAIEGGRVLARSALLRSRSAALSRWTAQGYPLLARVKRPRR